MYPFSRKLILKYILVLSIAFLPLQASAATSEKTFGQSLKCFFTSIIFFIDTPEYCLELPESTVGNAPAVQVPTPAPYGERTSTTNTVTERVVVEKEPTVTYVQGDTVVSNGISREELQSSLFGLKKEILSMMPASTVNYVSSPSAAAYSIAYGVASTNYVDDRISALSATIASTGGGQWGLNGTALYYNDGNVGIGTSTPSAPLVVAGDNFTGLYLKRGGVGTGAAATSIKMENRGDATSTAFWILQAGSGSLASGGNSGGRFSIGYNLTTNGPQEQFVISPDGNVGINTQVTSGVVFHPKAKLTVMASSTTESQLRLLSSRVAIVNGDLLGGIDFASHDVGLGGDVTAQIIAAASQTHSTGVLGTDMVFRVTSNGTSTPYEALRILNNRNVGIGTASPLSPLHVVGTSTITWGSIANSFGALTVGATDGTGGSLFVQTPSISSSYQSGFGVSGSYTANLSVINLTAYGARATPYGGDMALNTTENGNIVERIRIKGSGGYVGIGTSNPLAILSIAGDRSRTAWTTGGVNLQTNAAVYTDTSTGTSSTIAVRSVNSIGLPTLASVNPITITNASNFYIAGAPTAGTSTTIIGATALYVATGNSFFGGNVGIGTSTPSAQLTNTGTVRFGALGSAGASLITDSLGNVTVSSDERLKDVQNNFSSGLEQILKIQPISYKWKAETGYDTLSTYAGFSAQNIQSAIPEAVTTDSRGFLTLADRPILATLVNAVKELSVKVDGLKNMVVERFTVGSREKPSGITIFDEVTGEPYCIKVSGGLMINVPGDCSAVRPLQQQSAPIIPPVVTEPAPAVIENIVEQETEPVEPQEPVIEVEEIPAE